MTAKQAYLDSIVQLAIEHKITVYDSLLQPLEGTRLQQFYSIDTIIVSLEGRPKVIDNCFDYSAGTVAFLVNSSIQDTTEFQKNKHYIGFIHHKYADNGVFESTRNAFLVKRNTRLNDSIAIRKQALKRLKKNASDKALYQQILTKKNEYWTNERQEVYGKNYPLDSCHRLFQLRLNADLTFEQHYDKSLLCHTAAMQYGKKAAHNEDLFLRKIDSHKIKYPYGFWTIADHQLHLKTSYGVAFLAFEIEHLTSNTIVLKKEGNRIFLTKKTIK